MKVYLVQAVAKPCVADSANFYLGLEFVLKECVTGTHRLELELPHVPGGIYGSTFNEFSKELQKLYTIVPAPTENFGILDFIGSWVIVNHAKYGAEYPYQLKGVAKRGVLLLENDHTGERLDLSIKHEHMLQMIPEPVVHTKTMLDPEPTNKTNSAAQLQEQQVEHVCKYCLQVFRDKMPPEWASDLEEPLQFDEVMLLLGAEPVPGQQLVTLTYDDNLECCTFCPHDKSDPNKKPKL